MNKPLFPTIRVNGEPIAQVDIAAEAQHHPAPAGKPGIAWRKAAEAMVIRTLLLQEARKRAVEATPVELGRDQSENQEDALIRALLDKAVVAEPPGENAVREVWAAKPEAFASPTLWEASHILVSADRKDPEGQEKARRRAGALADILNGNPAAFSDLARRESDCSSKSNGGALGQLGPADTVPEFEAALQALEPGEITHEPVQTRFGYHIIRLDARADGQPLPFDAVRTGIAEALEKASWARAAREFITALVSAAKIEGIDLRSRQSAPN